MINDPTLGDPFGLPVLLVVALGLMCAAALAFLFEAAIPRYPVRQRYDIPGWILGALGLLAALIHLITL